jgi:hypothetical protein
VMPDKGFGIRIRALNVRRIWRFEIHWCSNYISLWWLSDWRYMENYRREMWTCSKPLVQWGDVW